MLLFMMNAHKCKFYVFLRDSSSGSDNEDLMYTLHSSEDRIMREEARESETECDRLCKK